MVSKWVECDPSVNKQESTSLTCHSWNVAPEKWCKVELHSHILDSMGLFESLRLNQEFGSSSLKKTKEALKIWVILDRGIPEASALNFHAFSRSMESFSPSQSLGLGPVTICQGSRNAEAILIFWPDGYLPASPPGPVGRRKRTQWNSFQGQRVLWDGHSAVDPLHPFIPHELRSYCCTTDREEGSEKKFQQLFFLWEHTSV